MEYIYIVPIETENVLWLEPLKKCILNTFGLQTKTAKLDINLKRTFDPYRRQYHSSDILLQIISRSPTDAAKIIGIVDVDLFIPVLTFVFGEAQINATGAVVSLHRLNSKFYGLPENREVVSDRIVKESIHELGHTFGLLHCSQPNCVMKSSTYVEDIDQKSYELCTYCQKQLVSIAR